MNIQSMVKELKRGKKMKRPRWAGHCYIFMEDCGCCITQTDYKGNDNGNCIFDAFDINAKDWEEVERK